MGAAMKRSSVRREAFLVDGGRILRWEKDGAERKVKTPDTRPTSGAPGASS